MEPVTQTLPQLALHKRARTRTSIFEKPSSSRLSNPMYMSIYTQKAVVPEIIKKTARRKSKHRNESKHHESELHIVAPVESG
jgi:hypothetical protein